MSTAIIDAQAPIGGAPPITSDPPFHQHARRLLLPPFVPKKIEPWEPEIRLLCKQRLDDLGDITPGATVVDAATQYAAHIPVNVIARMLGFPVEDDDLFRQFVHNTLEGINREPAVRAESFRQLDAYIDVQIEEHRANPRERPDDVPAGGRARRPEAVAGARARLDRAAAARRHRHDVERDRVVDRHLAQHPDDRRRLCAEPELLPTAIEELLAYAVTMARIVAKDHDFHGCPMKTDEWVLLPFPAANRDPGLFDRADEVVIDRLENRHAAFGLGIHRCLGSNLARLELIVAVDEFLQRFPEFELTDPDAVRWSVGQIRGRASCRSGSSDRLHAHPSLTSGRQTVAMQGRAAPGNRLLIAEDDRAVRDFLTRALELEGYTVTAVGNGAEALDAAASAQADVVVLDV